MKKVSILFLLLTAFVFASCSDDDKATLIISFEGKLAEANSEFISESKTMEGFYYTDLFEDNSNQLSFVHYYSEWEGYTAAGFTYTNKTDNSAASSIAAITKKGKAGTTYLYGYTNEYSPAKFTINHPEIYKMKGAWITNSTYSYNGITKGDEFAKPFVKGSSFKVIATGYTKNDIETGKAEIYLANYANDNDKPVDEWIWFDLSPLHDAVKVTFLIESTDSGTATSFCMDGVTLEEK